METLLKWKNVFTLPITGFGSGLIKQQTLSLGSLPEVLRKYFRLHTSRNAGVTLVLVLDASLTACGANGCWLLSLAACSCSLAKRCFSSRVRDIWGGGGVGRGKVNDVGSELCNTVTKGEGLRKWGVKLSSYSIRLRRSSCGSNLLPVDSSTAEYVIDLKARKGKECRHTVRIITVFARKENVDLKVDLSPGW